MSLTKLSSRVAYAINCYYLIIFNLVVFQFKFLNVIVIVVDMWCTNFNFIVVNIIINQIPAATAAAPIIK